MPSLFVYLQFTFVKLNLHFIESFSNYLVIEVALHNTIKKLCNFDNEFVVARSSILFCSLLPTRASLLFMTTKKDGRQKNYRSFLTTRVLKWLDIFFFVTFLVAKSTKKWFSKIVSLNSDV